MRSAKVELGIYAINITPRLLNAISPVDGPAV
jgi:hypothetical protein